MTRSVLPSKGPQRFIRDHINMEEQHRKLHSAQSVKQGNQTDRQTNAGAEQISSGLSAPHFPEPKLM